ncbi:MAG: tetratricopeptide repeat protein [Proteobacteria bacterium]|nr:tetratricopeptide repeat protein [Pseudomonadota bacterium]
MESKHIASHQTVSLLCFTIIIGMCIFFPSPASGEMKTVTHTVKQPFGGSQSPDDARIAAVARAKREALEMAGVYVEGLTVVKNSQVDKNETLALTAGVLKAEVVSQENYATKDAFGVAVVVRINVDTSVLEGRAKKLLADRTHLEQLNQARKKEKDLLDTVAKLQEENKRLTKSKQSTEQLKSQFQEASQGLMAVDWFDKATALWQDGKYSDPKKAIDYLNKTIRLKPDYADAYYNRGVAYTKLGQYQQAIKDYDEAIRLKPDYADAYYNRGIEYDDLGQHQQTIKDYNEAIHLKPDYTDAYLRRGAAYLLMGDKTHGCSDAQKACSLGNCKAYELAKRKGDCR